ncbi:hypothetical protein Tco_0900674, partial [Tanacetum coccineum]
MFPEEFLCLVGLSRHYTLDEETYPSFLDKDGEDMDIFAFIHTTDPSKVKVVEREQKEDEPRLLETTVGRTVPLLLVTPDRGESELDASVDKLFYKGDSVTETTDTVAEDVIPLQPRRQKKRKTIIADAGGPSHPPKKLREDHRNPSGASVGSKSRSTVQRLLAGAVQNVEVRGELIPTLPFVTSSVSSTPEHEVEDHTDSVEVDSFARPSVPVIAAATTITSTADPAVVVKEKIDKPSLFSADSTSVGGTDSAMGGFMDLTGSDFLFGGIRTVINLDFDLQKIYLFTEFNVRAARQISISVEVRMRAEYNIREKKRLKSVVKEKDQSLKARDEEIENLKVQMLLKEAEATEAIRLRTEASNFETVKKSIRVEVNALNERNTILKKECNALDVKVTNLEASVVRKERELTDSNAQLTSIKSQNDNLIDQVHELQASSSGLKEKLSHYENLTERLEEFQDAQLKVVNDKFNKLYADFMEMALHLEEKFYPHLLTTISYRRWLLTHGMKLAIAKCLNSSEYLFALRAAIGKAIKKGMHDRLSTGITHGKKGRVLTDVASYNPSAETNKDASVETLMNLLRLEETLAERLGLSTEGTSDVVPATADTTKALSITFASASTITPISVDDYEVTSMDDQATASESVTDENANPFPNVDDVALLIFQVRGSCFPSRSLNLYAPFPSASVTSYGPSHLGLSFLVSSTQLASLLRSTSAVLSVGMPISAGMIASVPYVNENGMSPLLDFIIVRCAYKTRGFSSIQFLLLASNLAFIPSPKLRFALSTRPLVYGCLTEVKCWRIHSFSPQSLNGSSQNCFPLSEMISSGSPNLQTILSHTNF